MKERSKQKLSRLKTLLRDAESALIAYSGGVDSTFLLYVAREALGVEKVLAVTAVSESFPKREQEFAGKMSKRLGVRYHRIQTKELANPKFAKNPVNRCYYCKKELFRRLKKVARSRRLKVVMDGSNYDDLKDVRYGMQAARELAIQSPLQESGLTKAEIRVFSRQFGLPTWNKPAFACLASRFPHNKKITRDELKAVNKAEDLLRLQGFRQIRVRHHGDIARIEVPADEIKRLCKGGLRDKITRQFKKLGFKYISVDLEGYRTGSMNLTKN